MGLFGKTKPRLASKPRKLKPGAFVPMEDLDPGFVEWARANKPMGRIGHIVTVRLDLQGNDIVARAGDGSIIGRMASHRVQNYYDEFALLQSKDQYGVAEVEISPAGKTERFVLCLNYDQYSREGGIL